MQDITEALEQAKGIIKNLVGSHQSTPEQAVIYALRQLNLPSDVTSSLIQYAQQTAKYK